MATDIPPPTAPEDVAWQKGYDAEVQAALGDALKGLVPEDAPAEAVANEAGDIAKPDGDGAAPQEASSEATAAPDETPPADAPPEDKVEDRSATSALLKLLEKDKELVDVKAQLKSEREAFETEKQAWYESRAKEDVIGADALKRILLTDPLKLCQVLGIGHTRVSQLLIAAQLGDKAPADLRRVTEEASRDAEIFSLREELNRHRQSTSAREYTDNIKSGIRDYTVKGLDKHPTVAAVHKSDAARVEAEIFQEICADAANRASREPNGQPLSFEAAAARVEKRWAAVAAAIKSKAPNSANDSSSSQTAPKTGQEKTGTPGLPPSKLTPAKPSPRPWQDPEWTAIVERELAQAVSNLKRG